MTLTNTFRRIYVGPNISGHRLKKGTTFIGGFPSYLDEVFEACPQIKHLFVPVSRLVEAEKAVNTAGTPLNKYYNLAKEI